MINKFYSIVPDSHLDKKNEVAQHMARAKKNMSNNQNSSLSTVEACSSMINNVLMG